MNNAAVYTSRIVRIGILIVVVITISGQRPTAAELSLMNPSFGRWSAPTLLADGAYVPVMDSANGEAILVYNRGTVGSINPKYHMLPEGSSVWSEATYIHSDLGEEFRQAMARFDTNGQAHAVWRGDSAVFYASQNQWAANHFVVVLEDNNKTIEDLYMAIGNDDVIHLVTAWQNRTGSNPYNISHTYFDGHSWSTANLLIEDTARRLLTTRVAVDKDGHVHVVWEERISLTPENYQIYYAAGTKLGDGYGWSPAVPISVGVDRARRPAILAEGNDLHVTFTRYISDSEQTIYYTQRPAASASWTTPKDITNNNPLAVNMAPRVMSSSMTLCQGSLHVLYFGGLAANTNEQIFRQAYRNGRWQSRETVTDNSARRIRPTAVCHHNRLHLAYEQVISPGENHAIYTISAYEQVLLPVIVKN
jgi:hypothetical protein